MARPRSAGRGRAGRGSPRRGIPARGKAWPGAATRCKARQMSTAKHTSHPLFRIAPLLDKGAMHDEYTSRLIGRLRAGRYNADIWDCNSLYLGYAERIGSPAYQQVAAIPSRYKMTPQEIAAYKADPAWKAERARLAEEQRARRAEKKAQREAQETAFAARRRELAEERERFQREWAEAQAKRQADQKQRDSEWAEREAEGEQRRQERSAILGGPWECTRCLRPALVLPWPEGQYELTCPRCARSTRADHATMLSIVARKAQLEPANSG